MIDRIGSYNLHREIHVLPPKEAGMVKLLIHDLDIPLGVVAPYKEDHPIVQKLGAETLARSSMEGTLAMLCNGGAVLDELARLSFEAGVPCMGSSANMTGKGTKSVSKGLPERASAVELTETCCTESRRHRAGNHQRRRHHHRLR